MIACASNLDTRFHIAIKMHDSVSCSQGNRFSTVAKGAKTHFSCSIAPWSLLQIIQFFYFIATHHLGDPIQPILLISQQPLSTLTVLILWYRGAFCTLHIIDIICDQFRKINHFVSFDTLNIYSWNKALHNTNQNYCELSFTLYYKLPEILWNILIAVCIQLWQQGKVLVSIVFMHDKVVDFPKSGHICKCMTQ